MNLTLTRSQIKACLRSIIDDDCGVIINTELIWKFRSIDRPLPCKMNPVDVRDWLELEVRVPLTKQEASRLYRCLKMSNESEIFDVVDILGGLK